MKCFEKKNKKGGKFYLRCLAFIFFIFPVVGSVEARFDHSNFVQKLEFQTNSTPKKKKGKSKSKVNQSKSVSVPKGNWGATGINLVVVENGAIIEYDCANGEITQKLMINEQGGFSVNGVYIRRYPGALRVKFPPKRQPARYEGKISGDKMTLKVTLTETGETLEEVVLERGKIARIHGCR
jgi:hypothetical protein